MIQRSWGTGSPMETTWARRLPVHTVRGVVGAMAMTGVRSLSGSLGPVQRTPPETLMQKAFSGWIDTLPDRRRQGVVELFHWATGAAAGAAFSMLPERVRTARFAGPLYGLAVLGGFELLTPLLNATPTRKRQLAEHAWFVLDHLVYGFVLAPPVRRPG